MNFLEKKTPENLFALHISITYPVTLTVEKLVYQGEVFTKNIDYISWNYLDCLEQSIKVGLDF